MDINLNLFDCQNLNRLNCIKTNKFHDLINNISLQHIFNNNNNNNINNSSNSITNDIHMNYSKGLFATTNKSYDNVLCILKFLMHIRIKVINIKTLELKPQQKIKQANIIMIMMHLKLQVKN